MWLNSENSHKPHITHVGDAFRFEIYSMQRKSNKKEKMYQMYERDCVLSTYICGKIGVELVIQTHSLTHTRTSLVCVDNGTYLPFYVLHTVVSFFHPTHSKCVAYVTFLHLFSPVQYESIRTHAHACTVTGMKIHYTRIFGGMLIIVVCVWKRTWEIHTQRPVHNFIDDIGNKIRNIQASSVKDYISLHTVCKVRIHILHVRRRKENDK